jgi:hypothetical protein
MQHSKVMVYRNGRALSRKLWSIKRNRLQLKQTPKEGTEIYVIYSTPGTLNRNAYAVTQGSYLPPFPGELERLLLRKLNRNGNVSKVLQRRRRR